MRSRLTALSLSFRENHMAKTGLRQLFVKDPSGILLELNFRDG
jgi:hypothetical protein